MTFYAINPKNITLKGKEEKVIATFIEVDRRYGEEVSKGFAVVV